MPQRIKALPLLAVLLWLAASVPGRAAKGETQPLQAGQQETKVRVAGVVLRWLPGDRAANYRHAEVLIREAASKGAQIVCTAESFLDGYSNRLTDLTAQDFRSMAEPVPEGASFVQLLRLCAELKIYLVAAITEADSDKVFNSPALIAPDGKLLGVYRKNFLWSTETDRYSPGEGFPSFATEYGRVGMMICSDRRRPEAVAALVKNGAELVFCPAGGGFGRENDEMMKSRSREGRVPIVFVHPVEFLVTGPDGSIEAQAVLGNDLDADGSDDLPGEVRLCDLRVEIKRPTSD